MPETINAAPPAAPLILTDTNPAYFMMRDQPTMPASVGLPGSSRFELYLFNATAVGTVNAEVPGTITFILYGAPKQTGGPFVPLAISTSIAEPIGGASDPDETMWMIEGCDLMLFSGSGKLQGMFKSNVANRPHAPVDLDHHPTDVEKGDPLYIFAVGASFTPDTPLDEQETREHRRRQGRADDAAATLCTCYLTSFTLNA